MQKREKKKGEGGRDEVKRTFAALLTLLQTVPSAAIIGMKDA